MKSNETKVILALDNIRSAQNVGALFRTADAIGVSEVWLIGITPAPIDRFGRMVGAVTKAALGAETLPWQSFSDHKTFIDTIRDLGYVLYIVEQDSRAVDYKTVSVTKPTVVVLGNEVEGIAPALKDVADVILEIPMRGKKESLNVSVAGGVVLYRLLDR